MHILMWKKALKLWIVFFRDCSILEATEFYQCERDGNHMKNFPLSVVWQMMLVLCSASWLLAFPIYSAVLNLAVFSQCLSCKKLIYSVSMYVSCVPLWSLIIIIYNMYTIETMMTHFDKYKSLFLYIYI